MSSEKSIVPRKSRKEWIGKRFGMLLVIARNGTGASGSRWLCKCDCGKETTISLCNLHRGKNSISCGCMSSRHFIGQRSKTHGGSKTETYRIWCGMIRRCEYKQHRHYHQYGGRGIKVCPEWRNSYEQFLKDMGERPANKSIDRIDTNGDYCKQNCRWATHLEQASNTRSNHLITCDGKTLNITQWGRLIGLDSRVIHKRLKMGWDVKSAVSTPSKYRKRSKN